jgi:hypothetical protein
LHDSGINIDGEGLLGENGLTPVVVWLLHGASAGEKRAVLDMNNLCPILFEGENWDALIRGICPIFICPGHQPQSIY